MTKHPEANTRKPYRRPAVQEYSLDGILAELGPVKAGGYAVGDTRPEIDPFGAAGSSASPGSMSRK